MLTVLKPIYIYVFDIVRLLMLALLLCDELLG